MAVSLGQRGGAIADKPAPIVFRGVQKICGLAREKALTTNANITN
jgi:hypothetical protein